MTPVVRQAQVPPSHQTKVVERTCHLKLAGRRRHRRSCLIGHTCAFYIRRQTDLLFLSYILIIHCGLAWCRGGDGVLQGYVGGFTRDHNHIRRPLKVTRHLHRSEDTSVGRLDGRRIGIEEVSSSFTAHCSELAVDDHGSSKL